MSSPPPPARPPMRRRRFLLVVAVVLGLMLFFGLPWDIPPSLKDAGLSALSRANIAQLTKLSSAKDVPKQPMAMTNVDEIYGLLHVVTDDLEHERILSRVPDLDLTKPINLTTYAAGNQNVDWYKEAARLNRRYPVVVFSKSYCGFSMRAKQLLATYEIRPTPKIIEVDLRDDAAIIKSILTRLTGRSTFPNVLVRARSIGGSDDLQVLHAERKLEELLQQAGAVVRSDGSGKRS